MPKFSLNSVISAKQFQNSGDPLIDILRDLPDALLMIDADGKIFYANPAAEKLFGFQPNSGRNASRQSAKSPPESRTKSARRSTLSRQTSNFCCARTAICGTTKKSAPSASKRQISPSSSNICWIFRATARRNSRRSISTI